MSASKQKVIRKLYTMAFYCVLDKIDDFMKVNGQSAYNLILRNTRPPYEEGAFGYMGSTL